MPEIDAVNGDSENLMQEQAKAELVAVFEKMPYEIPLILFTDPGKNEVFNQGARDLIRSARELAPKISLREYDMTHKMAQEWQVEHPPTLLFDPDNYQIRWLGAPLGEEGRTFLEALIMMGYRKTNLNKESLKILNNIQSPLSRY